MKVLSEEFTQATGAQPNFERMRGFRKKHASVVILLSKGMLNE